METKNYFTLFYSCTALEHKTRTRTALKCLRFSQQCCQGFKPSGLSNYINQWMVTTVSKLLRAFKMSVFMYQSTLHNFTDKINLHEQHHYCLTILNILQQLLYFMPAQNQVFKLIKWFETIITSWQPLCLGLHQVQRKHYWVDDGNTPTGS